MEPLNNGHLGKGLSLEMYYSKCVLYREVILSFEVKIIILVQYNREGPHCVSFIERLSSLWRLKCTSIIHKGSQCVLYREVVLSLEVKMY